MAWLPSDRQAASCSALATDSRPMTAMMTPGPAARSTFSPPVRSWLRDGLITASDSSSSSSNIMPMPRFAPCSLTTLPMRPSWARCTPTDAAALTAVSNEELGPVPMCAPPRVSSSTVARFRQRCSSRRTISSP